MSEDITAATVEDATEGKTTASRPVNPVVVTVIGTGDAGRLPTGTVARTDGVHQPNVITTVVTPLLLLLLRGSKAFMVSFVGVIGVGGPTGIIPAHSFWDLALKAASLSVGVGFMAVANALVEVLTKLDQKFPSWTA